MSQAPATAPAHAIASLAVLRPALRALLLLGSALASGCTHNYYYGAVPGCPPGTQPVTTQLGSICDVPSSSIVTNTPSTAISSNVTSTPSSASGAMVANSGTPSRVVISQPAYAPTLGQSLGKLRWRRPDPETLANTRVEGGYDDGTIQR